MSEIGIGDTLRGAREEQGRTLDEAARDTRVRTDYLRALEEESFDVFGGDVYAKGFLSTYARYLQLDPTPLLERYRRFVQHDEYDTSSLAAGPVARGSNGRAPTWIAWAVAAVAIIVGGVALVNVLGPNVPEQAAQNTPPPRAAQTPTEPATPTPSPTPSPTPTYEGVELLLAFEDDSWIEVQVDGQTIESGRVVEGGEVLTFQGEESVTVRFGNAGGVRAEVNGQDLGLVGPRGAVQTVTFTPEGAEPAA